MSIFRSTELIPELLKRWEEGHDIVYAIRMDRTSDKTVKRLTAKLFYRIYNLISHEPIPFGAGDYRVLDRRVVTALRQLRERNRFMKGLFAWVDFLRSESPTSEERDTRAPQGSHGCDFGI